jgi:hypothetical protein
MIGDLQSLERFFLPSDVAAAAVPEDPDADAEAAAPHFISSLIINRQVFLLV